MKDIRIAQEKDAEALPDIERSAGEAFRTIPDLAWIADEEDQTVERYRELIGKGTSWVAVDDGDQLLGFLSAEIQDGNLHIWELAVRHDRQGSGIGRALVEKAVGHARTLALFAVTLTTFRDVKWNEAFYETVGFETLDHRRAGARLDELLRQETERGLPQEKRCAMCLILR